MCVNVELGWHELPPDARHLLAFGIPVTIAVVLLLSAQRLG